jgi:hypothetical protein
MPTTKMYSERAVIFDFAEYPEGLETTQAHIDFVAAANEECHSFLPPDWYVKGYFGGTSVDGASRTIVVGLERYKDSMNLQPLWNFVLTADPLEDDDTQWIVFDVVRWQPDNLYSFQLP